MCVLIAGNDMLFFDTELNQVRVELDMMYRPEDWMEIQNLWVYSKAIVLCAAPNSQYRNIYIYWGASI